MDMLEVSIRKNEQRDFSLVIFETTASAAVRWFAWHTALLPEKEFPSQSALLALIINMKTKHRQMAK